MDITYSPPLAAGEHSEVNRPVFQSKGTTGKPAEAPESSAVGKSPAEQVDETRLNQAMQDLAKHYGVEFKRTTDEKTGRQIIQVFSPDGERMLRQFPPQAVVEMAAKARQGMAESLFNSTV
ncbi:MAG: flagellar protein FlaG [Deltaproteobacteria bacterium]|nr:flagellar protein FlaG [Deltaproteobacteria bacterium]